MSKPKPPELYWPIEDIRSSEDTALALFYALLDDGDRTLLRNHHIDIHRDLRLTLT